jgi:hypothetical protein
MKQHTSPIAGADYLTFLADQQYWPQSEDEATYAQDVVLEVDGVRINQDELTPDTITEDCSITIISGEVFDGFDRLHTLREHYESWKAGKVKLPQTRDCK